MTMFLKIPQSVRSHFEPLEAVYHELRPLVDAQVMECIPDRWFYFSRIKTIESFYVKMLQGRRSALYEDILAATVVVERAAQIPEAVGYLSDCFDLVSRRPEKSDMTLKRPESFIFDDLRLYLKLKERTPNGDFPRYPFEIQVKTYLQHAWSIASHDLIYKTECTDSWAKKRVAYQIKAMLEHVETSISKVEDLAASNVVKMSTEEIEERLKIAEQLQQWGYNLGQSTSRMVENIQNLINHCNISWGDVVQWVDEETANNASGGCNAMRFSVFEIVLDALCKHNFKSLKKWFSYCGKKNRSKLLVSTEFLDLHHECDIYCEGIAANNV